MHVFSRDLVVVTVVEQAVILGIAWLFMRRKVTFRDLGLRRLAWRDLGWGALFFAGGFLVAYAANLVLHATNGFSTMALVYAMRVPWLEIPALSIAWGLSSGIVYQGYVLQGLMRDWPSRTWLAVLVSGILFSVPHILGSQGSCRTKSRRSLHRSCRPTACKSCKA